MYCIPYSVIMMKRGGKYRRCVIQWHQWPNGSRASFGRCVFMAI